jgi:hypothetical protein
VPQQTGIELIVISGVSLALIAPPSVRGIRARRARTLGLGLLISRFGLSMLGCIAVGVLGALFYLGATSTAFTDIVWIVVALPVIAVRNTWDLLVTVAAPAVTRRQPPHMLATHL